MEIRPYTYRGLPFLVASNGDIYIEGRDVLYSDGRVRHYPRRKIPQNPVRDYQYITVSLQQITINIRVNRLVAFAYPEVCGEYFEGAEANHLDENHFNNDCSNLRWVTRKENVNWGTATERRKQKVSKQVLCVETGVVYPSYQQARIQMGHPKSTCIRDVCLGRQKTAYGYHWRYV